MISLTAFTSAWDRFFYPKTDALGLSIFRIFLGVFLLINGLSLAFDFTTWYGVGPESVFPLVNSLNTSESFRVNLFRWFPATQNSANFIFLSYIVSSATFMLGFETKKSALVCFLMLVSLQTRNYAILNSGDSLLRCLLFVMIFAPSDAVLSVDCWLKKRAGQVVSGEIPITAVRLLQLQFSFVYLATTLFKLKGYDWVEGTAVYYTSRLQNFQRLTIPLVFDVPILVRVSTWAALFIEFAMGTLVWVKELRRPVLIAGIALHLLIEMTMSIGYFEWLMISAYVLFFTPLELRQLKLGVFRVIAPRFQSRPG